MASEPGWAILLLWASGCPAWKLGWKAAVSKTRCFWALLGGGGVHIRPALQAFSKPEPCVRTSYKKYDSVLSCTLLSSVIATVAPPSRACSYSGGNIAGYEPAEEGLWKPHILPSTVACVCSQPTNTSGGRVPSTFQRSRKGLCWVKNSKSKLLQLLSTFWCLLWDLSENWGVLGAVPCSPSVMNRQKTGSLEVGTSGLKHQISSLWL